MSTDSTLYSSYSSSSSSKLDQACNADFYKVLALAKTASPEEVKAAYHRALITHHPDKNSSKPATVHVATIKEAYEVLSSPSLRALYDFQLEHKTGTVASRPAQVISLEEFEEDPIDAAV